MQRTAALYLRRRGVHSLATAAVLRPLAALRFQSRNEAEKPHTSAADGVRAEKAPQRVGLDGTTGYQLNYAPWISERAKASAEVPLLKRYWVLCGPALVFLFAVWGVWWLVQWKRWIGNSSPEKITREAGIA